MSREAYLSSLQRLHRVVSHCSLQSRLLDAAVQLRVADYEPEKAFISREMVQATLPHKTPGDVPAWSRANGNYAFTVE